MKFTANEKTNLLIELVKSMNRGDTPHSEAVAKQHVTFAAIQVEKILEYSEKYTEQGRKGE